MAATKLSALTAATSLAGSDLIYVVEGGVSKSITKDVFISQFNVEKRTSDYAASAANVGKVWARTDTGEIKTVTDNGGAYAVDQLNRFTAADETKLDGIEAGAEVNPTDAETKTAYENNADTNAFTDAEQTKLTGIEANATQYALAEPRASDLGPTAGNVGQIWSRDNLDGDVKTVVQGAAALTNAWASGGALNQGRNNSATFGPSSDDMITAGGGGDGADTRHNETESYNGTSWTDESANVVTGRHYTRGCGTTGAGLMVGGLNSSSALVAASEEWNGTSWSTSGNDTVARRSVVVAGIQTDARVIGGYTTVGLSTVTTYNGTSFSASTALTSERWEAAGGGTSSDAFVVTGYNSGSTRQDDTYTWDGASWSTGATYYTDVFGAKGIGSSSSSFVIATGHDGTILSTARSYDGTSYTTENNTNEAKYFSSSNGSFTSGLLAGGVTSGTGQATTTEEWSSSATPTYSVESLKYGKIEGLTADLTANSGNAGRMWMRTDLTTPTVKAVVAYDDGGGTEIYAVRTFTTT